MAPESEDSHCWREQLQLRRGDGKKETVVPHGNGRYRYDYVCVNITHEHVLRRAEVSAEGGVHGPANVHIFFALSAERPEEQGHPVVMSISRAHLLVPRYYSSIKKPGFLGRRVDSRAWAGKIQDEPGKHGSALKHGGVSEGHRS